MSKPFDETTFRMQTADGTWIHRFGNWQGAYPLRSTKASRVTIKPSRLIGAADPLYPQLLRANVFPEADIFGRAITNKPGIYPYGSATGTTPVTSTSLKAGTYKRAKIKGKGVTKRKQAALWGRYVPCEYIESSGTQRIDTGYVLTGDEEIEFDFQYTDNYSAANKDAFFTGTQNINTSKGGFWIEKYVRTSTWQWYVRYSSLASVYSNQYSTGLNDRHSISISAGSFKVDGTNVLSPANDGTYQSTPVTIFGRFSSDGVFGGSKSKCWKYTIKKNGSPVRDYVPVKDVVDNVYGMFDRVTGKFYGNAGTGAFTGGSLIQPISYAQTDGTACADTDLLLNGSEKWTIKFASLKGTLSTPVAGSLNGGTAFTDINNFCVTYTTATSPSRYSVYVDGNAGATNNSWNGGEAADKAWHVLEYFGNVNTAPKLDGVNMATIGATARIAVTPSVPWRLFGRATTAKGTGTKSQDGVAIARFTGDTWDYLPVRIGTTVELLDLVSWTFATRTGTFTAGADIPYTQLCPDILETNAGDALYGQYGKNLFDNYEANLEAGKTYTISAILTAGTRKHIYTYDANGTQIRDLISWSSADAGYKTATFTANAGEVKCRYANAFDQVSELQLEEGSTPTPYEPPHFGLHPSGEQKVLMGEQGVETSINNVQCVGVQAQTNYGMFNKSAFPNVAVGDIVSVAVNSKTYSVEVKAVDASYVYLENREVQ